MTASIPADMLDLFSEPALGHVSYTTAAGQIVTFPMWVDFDGSHLLASSPVGTLRLTRDGDDARIYGFTVARAQQGRGIGRAALCRACEQLRAEGSHRIGLEVAVERADLVLTGEGSLDGQTLEGKAPIGVAALARRFGRPVIAFGGRVEEAARAALRSRFDELVALSDLEPELTQAQRMAREPELLCRHAARLAARAAAAGLRL